MKQSQKQKKRVFLTGATGNWGQYILREFARRADRFDVLALVLPTPKDTAAIRQFEDMENLSVVFGDVTDYPHRALLRDRDRLCPAHWRGSLPVCR